MDKKKWQTLYQQLEEAHHELSDQEGDYMRGLNKKLRDRAGEKHGDRDASRQKYIEPTRGGLCHGHGW